MAAAFCAAVNVATIIGVLQAAGISEKCVAKYDDNDGMFTASTRHIIQRTASFT